MWLQLILFLSLCGASGLLQAQPVELSAGSSSFGLSGQLSASPLARRIDTPEEALAQYRSGQFLKLPGFLGRGIQTDAVWLAFDLHAALGPDQSLVAQVSPAYLDYVTAWQADAAGHLSLLGRAGDQVPLIQVPIPVLKPGFDLRLAGGASATVLLRIETTSPLVATVKLYRARDFPTVQTTEGLLLGVEGSAFLTMGVVALGMFWLLRERIYLLWLALILSMAGQAFMSTGMAYRYLNWADLYNVNKFTNAFTVLAIVVTTLFANALFDFKALHRWLHGYIIAWAVLTLVVTSVAITLTLPMAAKGLVLSFILTMIIAFIGVVLQMLRRHQASLRYGPMFLLTFLVAAATMLATGTSWLPYSELTASAWQVAGVCNVLSLQVAMLSRALEARRKHAQERAQMLTQLKQQNQELEARVLRRTESLSKALHDVQQAESSQRQLLSMASHEFRTPAASIKASLDSLAILKDQVPPELASRLVNMRQASVRMIEFANNLIDEDRLHELALKPQVRKLDLHQLVTEVMARYGAMPEVVADLPVAPLHVTGDAALLGIALHNLIDNALRHGRPARPQQPVIRVSLQVLAGHVELTVSDNGPGIPDSKKEWVFERYHAGAYRDSDESDGPVSTSSGLGLSIVQDIAQAHGGTAVVRDLHPHGTMLVLSLPR